MDFAQLPPYQPRRFVPAEVNLRDKDQVAALYEQVLSFSVNSVADLEQFILQRSELDAAVNQVRDVLYIKMTCQTDAPDLAQAYTDFVEQVIPAIKPLEDQLNRRYVDLIAKFPLDPKRYAIYSRAICCDIELFRQENVPLQTQLQLLSQEYQTICGAMTVRFQGQEFTLPQMAKFLEEPDRELREAAWRALAQRRLTERDRLDSLFDKMLGLRVKVAANAGCRDFIEYQFRAYHRFDYTQSDCELYHATIEELLVPVMAKITQQRKKQMKLGALRPWDTQVDPLGRPPLRPFVRVDDLIKGTNKIFDQVHPDLGRQFDEMARLGLLDLESRKGKAPGGYQNTLTETRKPFIFMNAVGVDDDVNTLLHEGGHAFHAYASAADPIVDYRHAPMEFCEVASMAMELLGAQYLDVFYNEEERQRVRRSQMEGIIQILVWVANVDAFQQWIYEHPRHTPQERREAWLKVYQRFGGGLVDWQGLEEFRESLWHRQLHIFEVPFYYIEYGIAQLGALQIWLNSKKDFKKAVQDYRRGLALGGSRSLPELFKAAGLEFDFSKRTIEPLAKAVVAELGL